MSFDDFPQELRVHGVGGPQARKMLGELSEEDVVTLPRTDCPDDPNTPFTDDDASRFVRRVREVTQPNASPSSVTHVKVEAYEWGGLTTGSWSKALWILYLPFSLINAAGWAHGATHTVATGKRRVLVRAHVALVHLLAALATCTYVAWMGYVVLDLVAIKWKVHVLEGDEVTGYAADAVGAWVPAAAPIVFAGIVAALLVAPVLISKFEAVGDQVGEPWPLVPSVGHPTFFAHEAVHRRLRRAHLVLASIAVAAVILQYVTKWNRMGLAIIVIAGVQAVLLAVLCAVDILARRRQVVVDDAVPAADYPWVRGARMPAGAGMAMLGTSLTHAAFAGLGILAQSRLADWPEDGPADGPPHQIDVGAELGASDLLSWMVVLVALMVGATAVRLATRRAPNGGPKAGLIVAMARHAPLANIFIIASIATPLLVYAWLNASGQWPSWRALVQWYDTYSFDDNAPAKRIGALLLLALPGVVFVALRGAHDSGPARLIGNVWDVLTFWPRRFHPYAAPCSAERAVPELRARIDQILVESELVVVAHSQGSVLSAAAIAERHATKPQGRRPTLVTFGSPLGTLYLPTGPAYIAPLLAAVKQATDHETLGGRWENYRRETDPVGAQVPYAINPPALQDPQAATTDDLGQSSERPPLERCPRWGTTAGHSHYLTDTAVRDAIQSLGPDD